MIPWQLVLSVVPVLCLLVVLVHHARKTKKNDEESAKATKSVLLPLVQTVQRKHKEKFGRANTALEQEFHEMQQAK